ncbi:hypothetical protein [Streptomyces rishiriensis]|uniref:hypothetical protein n=1 Tax=Streptomyces rishiriensis TaxID=68264 RepID=UPI0027D7B863|nr:hypothetical protein [Streptomyces rishiriensis]
MSSAPIVVHPPSRTGGRRATVNSQGQDEIFGTAYSDHHLVVFLEGSGIQDPDSILDDDPADRVARRPRPPVECCLSA